MVKHGSYWEIPQYHWCKFMIGKTLATNGEEITNAMIGNSVTGQFIGNHW